MKMVRRIYNRVVNRSVRGQVVIIYTMGKVGSSSVHYTMKKNLPNIATFHVHFLSSEWLSKVEETPFQRSNILNAKYVRKYIRDNQPERIKIISLVRDPVSVEISGLFQNWERYFDVPPEKVSDERIIHAVKEKLGIYPLDWFDSEFQKFTEIDAFQFPFQKEQGYQILRKENIDVLILKLEKLDEVFPDAMKEFIGRSLTLENANVTSDKPESFRYKEIRDAFKLSESELDSLYKAKMPAHFYTTKEIDEFKSKWKK